MNGSCLCGAVRWSFDGTPRDVLECHCHRCQKHTGNYMAATAGATDAVRITGDTVRWYSPEDDPNVAYGFCATCGSSLFFRSGIVDGTNTSTSLCAGSVDGPSGLRTTEVWFAGNAADHVRLSDDVTRFVAEPTRQAQA